MKSSVRCPRQFISVGRIAILRLLVARRVPALIGHVPPGDAAGGGANDAMADRMTGDAAHDHALDAALGLRLAGKSGDANGQRESDCEK